MTDVVLRVETRWFKFELTREGLQVLVQGSVNILVSVAVVVVTQ